MGKVWIPGGGGGADLDLVTATAADIRNGKIIIDQDGNPLVGTMIEKAEATYTPGTANKTIAANQYLKGAQTIKGDANLVASKIKKGVTIFGITGTWEGYVTSPLNLFNNGTWSNLQKTGITCLSTLTTSKVDDDEIVIQGKSGEGWNYSFETRLNQTVDLTNHKFLKVDVTWCGSEARCSVGVFTDSNLKNEVVTTGFSAGVTGTLIVDISSLSGSYYIGFGGKYSWGNTYRFKRLYLSNT